MRPRDRRSKGQKVKDKRLYDIEYRKRNRDLLKAKQQAYHLKTYDPDKERIKRKERMPRHVEYCRQPEYKRWKREYDRQYRAKKYGPFAESYMLTIDLNRAIKGRMTNEQIKWENGTFNKAHFRASKANETERSRPRFRRPNHSAADGQ